MSLGSRGRGGVLKLGLGIVVAAVFVLSLSFAWQAAIPTGLLLGAVLAWPAPGPTQEQREAALAARGEAALEAMRKLGRDYPGPTYG